MTSTPRGANEYFDISLDRDGQTAAVVGGDSRARIIDLATGTELAVFTSGSVARAQFLRGGRSLVTTSFDQAVHVFELPGPTASVGSLTLVGLPPDQAQPHPGIQPNALFPRLRALSKTAPNLVNGDPAGLVDTIVVNPDGTRAAILNKRAIEVFDISDPITPTHLGTISNALVDVRGLTFSPDGKLAIGRGLTESVEFWNTNAPTTPTLHSTLRFGRGFPTTLAFSPDGRTLAVGSHRTGNVTVYNVNATPTAPHSPNSPTYNPRAKTSPSP
ncbi:WD40 repeat domain-containing protein [Nocardia fluminea]|uniref:WD40 repeat domain-containing protein n=1 Tax=Nocardia fluminea TaxID=134984 RepID=UPI00367318DE